MKMLRGKMPNNYRGGAAMGKVNLLLLAALLTTSACVFKSPQPKSDLRAVTDGKLTLGVVASRDEQNGSNAYRLLLCKKSALKASHFDDSSFCRAALRDTSGAEVVLLANERRRSFAAKYGGYAAVLAGATLAAVGVHQGVKWAKVSSKKIDEVSKSIDKGVAQIKLQEDITGRITTQEELLKSVSDTMNAALKDAIEAHGQAVKSSTEVSRLQKELDRISTQANSGELKGVIERFKKIDPDLGERLDSLVYGSKAPLNEDLLNVLTSQVKDIDSAFNRQLDMLKTDPGVMLGSDGVRFYHTQYGALDEQYKQFMEDYAKSTAEFLSSRKKTPEFVAAFTNEVNRRRQGAILLEAATELKYFEEYRHTLAERSIDKILTEVQINQLDNKANTKASEIVSEKINMQFGIEAELAKELGINPNDDFPTKFEKIKEHYDALTEDDHLAILSDSGDVGQRYQKHVRATKIEELYLRGIDDFSDLRNSEKYLKLSEVKDANKYADALEEVDGEIKNARENLLLLEGFHLDHTKIYAAETQEFWDQLSKLGMDKKIGPLRQERIAALDKEVEALGLNMDARVVELDEQQKVLAGLKEKHPHLKLNLQQKESHLAAQKQIVELKQADVDDLKAQLASAKKGQFDVEALKIKKAEMEENKKLWGRNTVIAGGGAALGATAAVALSLDESIWGHGEEAIGKKYWQQIFAADKGFANPLPVNNLPEIVRQIAQVFGKEVNQSAFDLR